MLLDFGNTDFRTIQFPNRRFYYRLVRPMVWDWNMLSDKIRKGAGK